MLRLLYNSFWRLLPACFFYFSSERAQLQNSEYSVKKLYHHHHYFQSLVLLPNIFMININIQTSPYNRSYVLPK